MMRTGTSVEVVGAAMVKGDGMRRKIGTSSRRRTIRRKHGPSWIRSAPGLHCLRSSMVLVVFDLHRARGAVASTAALVVVMVATMMVVTENEEDEESPPA